MAVASAGPYMQVICTSLQTDNHASTSPVSFYRPDALPAAQPIASKHWRHKPSTKLWYNKQVVLPRWSWNDMPATGGNVGTFWWLSDTANDRQPMTSYSRLVVTTGLSGSTFEILTTWVFCPQGHFGHFWRPHSHTDFNFQYGVFY